MAAAVDVFSASGFHKGSLRDVADLAGLSQAGVLHHFPSKHHLIEAVLAKRDEDIAREFLAGVDQGLEMLRALLSLIESNQRKTPELVELYALLSAEATAPEHPAHGYFEQRYKWIVNHTRDSLERVAAEGTLREEVDTASAARTLVALIDGLQIQWLYDRESVDMAAEVRRFVQSLLTVPL